MPRKRHLFSPEDIAFVRQAYRDGSHSLTDICEHLGIKMTLYRQAAYVDKVFGELPSRQGQGKKKRPPDTKDMIMGVQRKEFERRRDAVRDAWSDAMRNNRITWCPQPGKDKRWDSGGMENRADLNNPIKQAPKPPNPNPWFDS